MPTFSVLHAALEYGDASYGGLGAVTTQMVEAQNKSNIITPYYPKIFKHLQIELLTNIEHLYNGVMVSSEIYLNKLPHNKRQYLLRPMGLHRHLFDIDSINLIYNNSDASKFIDRVKYFNSAVAAYLAKYSLSPQHPKPEIIIIHDWQVALLPKILVEVHNHNKIKSIFIVHISNVDYGAYHAEQLQGIGLNFSPGWQMLKLMGLKFADKIVAVSPSFFHECVSVRSDNANVEMLRKTFVLLATKGKVTGILNGFDFNKFNIISKTLNDTSNIYIKKQRIKYQLVGELSNWYSNWKIDPTLPIIFYIGRFSPEKGVDTFAQLIKLISNRATFFALGRGTTQSVQDVIQMHSKKTPNVFISNREEDQKLYAEMMRACADFTFVCSLREACCLVTIEGLANGSPCITSGVGGIKDSIVPMIFSDKNRTKGNGFLYEAMPKNSNNPSLEKTVDQSLSFWSSLNPQQKNAIHLRLIDEAKSFDWLAPNGAMSKYLNVFEEVLQPEKSTKAKADIERKSFTCS